MMSSTSTLLLANANHNNNNNNNYRLGLQYLGGPCTCNTAYTVRGPCKHVLLMDLFSNIE